MAAAGQTALQRSYWVLREVSTLYFSRHRPRALRVDWSSALTAGEAEWRRYLELAASRARQREQGTPLPTATPPAAQLMGRVSEESGEGTAREQEALHGSVPIERDGRGVCGEPESESERSGDSDSSEEESVSEGPGASGLLSEPRLRAGTAPCRTKDFIKPSSSRQHCPPSPRLVATVWRLRRTHSATHNALQRLKKSEQRSRLLSPDTSGEARAAAPPDSGAAAPHSSASTPPAAHSTKSRLEAAFRRAKIEGKTDPQRASSSAPTAPPPPPTATPFFRRWNFGNGGTGRRRRKTAGAKTSDDAAT